MSDKIAASEVHYSGEVLDRPAIYQRSLPVAQRVYALNPNLVYEWPSSIFRIECNANEDFDLPLQLNWLDDDGSERPLDLTIGGAEPAPVLEFYIRPRFDHTTIIKKLTVGAGIMLQNAVGGQVRLFLPQATVAADLIVSKRPAQHWDYFFNWKHTATPRVLELFRGPLVVHAGIYP